MTKIESVQYQAALAITGTWQGTSMSKLYNELGLESLNVRRSSNRVIQLFKIKNNFTPDYPRHTLTPLAIENTPNANPNIFEEKRTRTIRYKKSFFPYAISSWNNIITNIVGNLSKGSIKTHILKIIIGHNHLWCYLLVPVWLYYIGHITIEFVWTFIITLYLTLTVFRQFITKY